jgi:hypothetical protein
MGWMTGLEPATSGATVGGRANRRCRVLSVYLRLSAQTSRLRWAELAAFLYRLSHFFHSPTVPRGRSEHSPLLLLGALRRQFVWFQRETPWTGRQMEDGRDCGDSRDLSRGSVSEARELTHDTKVYRAYIPYRHATENAAGHGDFTRSVRPQSDPRSLLAGQGRGQQGPQGRRLLDPPQRR